MGSSNKVAPEEEDGKAQKSVDVQVFTEDVASGPQAEGAPGAAADSPAQAGSLQSRLLNKAWLWISGRKPRSIDASDVQDGKDVVAFAESLLPMLLQHGSKNRAVMSLIKLLMFVACNALLAGMLFIYPRVRTYTYLVASPANSSVTLDALASSGYHLLSARTSGMIALNVGDQALDAVAPGNAAFVAAYTKRVQLPFDGPGPPGWNLQDLLGLPRLTADAADAYVDPATGERMVQDYRVCAAGCVGADGMPADMVRGVSGLPSRNYTLLPYGTWGDAYVHRSVVLRLLDPDFYDLYLNGSISEASKQLQGSYGLPVEQLTGDLNTSTPTDSGHLCGLGRGRRRLTRIVLATKSCFVQITSAPGDGYSAYVRTADKFNVTRGVEEVVHTNTTSGCSTYELRITAESLGCPRPQLHGVDRDCELACVVILYKGIAARRVPIHVEESKIAGSWPSTLHIDDRFLVLERAWPDASLPDLSVTGGNIQVNISNARIARLDVQNNAGTIALDHARVDTALLNSTESDVLIEDDRDTELLYRSAGNLLCAAAPLVEAIPSDFLRCDPISHALHNNFDVVLDGYVDKAEFEAGLHKLGLSFGPESLALSPDQQQELYNHIFSEPEAAAHGSAQSITPAILTQRLKAAVPPLLTLYDTPDKAACATSCASGDWTCKQACKWACGTTVNVSEPQAGYCDPRAGCTPTCGQPDRPVSVYGASTGEVAFGEFDASGDGLLDLEEMKMALLWVFGNCTYAVTRSSDNARCVVASGPTLTDPSSLSGAVHLNCTAGGALGGTQLNADGWETANERMPDMSAAQSTVYGGVAARECRPFPDYDPRLSGRAYNASATLQDCPACFFPSGNTRVPPQYYNRSTWSPNNYDRVMAYIHALFDGSPLINTSVPYLNLTDPHQWEWFASQVLTPGSAQDRVTYATFDRNMATVSSLPFMGSGQHLLLDPACYSGRFLKVRPSYSSTGGDSAAALAAQRIQLDPNSPDTILDSRMPGYTKTNLLGEDDTLNACPEEWGNGTQGSTSFTWFPTWANSSIGYKWGKALPAWCLDERWTDGGIWNGSVRVYPADELVYGALAGQPVLPGCETAACKPTYKVAALTGSIHAQVLPFTFDAWNATGNYQTMVAQCNGPDGSPRCFYKGWPDTKDASLHPIDNAAWTALMDPCYADDMGCSDNLHAVSVLGPGAPSHEKWFWSARKVYMEVEPAWFYIMSGTILKPDVFHVDLRLNPGFCAINYGAIEHMDWRYPTVQGAPDSPISGLRAQREETIFTRMQENLNGTQPSRAGWYLKQVWRTPYINESLQFSQSTADGNLDTQPGFVDAGGKLQGGGVSYRHHRVCPLDGDCQYDFSIYRDNCKVQREMLPNPAYASDASVSQYMLSDCTFSNGSSAFADLTQKEAGLTWNESSYYAQFPLGLLDYNVAATHALKPVQLLDRDQLLSPGSHLWNNVTSKSYTKWEVNVLENGDVTFTDAADAWKQDAPLYAAIALSVVIAAMCGMMVMAMVVYFGLKYLQQVNAEFQARAKIEAQRLDEYKARLFEEILEAKQIKMTVYRLRQRLDSAAATIGGPNEVDIADTAVDVSDVVLSDPEKVAILKLMEEEGFHSQNVREWKIRQMVLMWATEIEERKLPPGDFTLLLPPSEEETVDVQQALGSFTKRSVTLVIKENGPHAPPRQQTFNGYALAGNKALLKKVKKLFKYEAIMNKLRTKPNKAAKLRKRTALERILLANAARINRLRQLVVSFFMYDFPSPFQVLHMFVTDQLQAELVDSLKTFLLVKCLFDHNLDHKEQLLLGNVDLFDVQDLHDASKRYSSTSKVKSGKAKKDKKGEEGGSSSAKASANGKSAARNLSSSSSASLPLPGPEFIQFEGHGEVVASASVDGRMELYRVKYVRIRMRKIKVQEATPDEGEDSGWLVKPTTRWEVLIDEGPGVITSSKYDADAEPQADCSVQAWEMQPDGRRALKCRTLVLPCPTMEELHELQAAEKDAANLNAMGPAGDARPFVDTAARRRHYIVNTAQGPTTISIDTVPDPARGDHQAARIEFSCRMGTFQPQYDKFCHNNGLAPKVVVDSTTLLQDMGISIKKNVATKVKGIRHKPLGATSTRVPLGADAASSNVTEGGNDGSAGNKEEDALKQEGSVRATALLQVEAEANLMDHGLAEQASQPQDADDDDEQVQQEEGGDMASPLQQSRAFKGRRLRPQLSDSGEGQPLLGSRRRSTYDFQDSDDEDGATAAGAGGIGTSVAGSKRGSKGASAGAVRPSAGHKLGEPPVKKAKPATAGLKQLLEASSDPLAAFVRETYDVTGNFGADSVDVQDMQKAYRRWCRQKQLAAAMAQSSSLGAEAAAAANAAALTLSLEDDGAELESPLPAAATPAVTTSPALAATASMMALPRLSAPALNAAVPVPVLPQSALVKPFHKGDLWKIGLRVVEEPEAVLKGTVVNLEADSADPKDVNKSVYLAAELLAVVLHTAFIWVMPAPCLILLFGYQSFFQSTTAIYPQLTLDTFRNHPLSGIDELPVLLSALLYFSLCWVGFCYLKLLCHYTMWKWELASWRIVLKTVFWMYFVIMVALAVAYGFEIFCWVILGAVINPNKFLPYSVACVTMAGHAQATYARLEQQFVTYRALLAKIVQNGFDAKLASSIDLAKQAQMLLEGNVEGVMQDVTAAAEQTVQAVQASMAAAQAGDGSAAGAAGAAEGGGPRWPGLGVEASTMAVGVPVVPGAAAGALAAGAARRVSLAAQASTLAAGGANIEMTKAPGARATAAQVAPIQAGSAVAAGAGPGIAAGGAAGAATGGGKKQEDVQTWKVFKMFAADDDSLDYAEFCALLDYFEIHLINEKRRKLYARVDTSGDGAIGYSEFQAAYHLLQEQIVDQHMKKAGLTTGSLIMLLAYAIVVLMLIFVFIFLGVAAFTGASTMGAIVNSLMTAGSGIAMNLKKEDKEEDNEKVESEVLKDL